MEVSDSNTVPWGTSVPFFVGLVTVVTSMVACVFGHSTKQRTVKQYMHGGKKMAPFPVAMSFVGSAISGITLLNIPVEVYLHGTQLLGTLLSLYIAIAIVILFILPTMYNQQYNSLFEFLEVRYSKNTRAVMSAIFILKTILYIPFVIAIPATSFSRVAAVPPHLTISILSTICILYTTVGGFGGVIWSQFLQVTLMTASLVFIVFIGCLNSGGFDKVLEVADSGGRLEFFNINPDPFARNTFWTTVIGMSISWLYFLGTNPGSYQKLVSLPKEQNAAKALLWFGMGVTVVKLLMVFLGLVMYAEFSDCDPLSIKEASKELLMLYYISKESNQYHGLEAVFAACVLSVALSFMSTNLNTVSGIIYEDFIKKHWPGKLKEQEAGSHIRRITVLVGALITLLSLFCNHLNPILTQLLLSVHRFTDGAMVAAFFIGSLRIQIKSKAVITATLVSMCATCWIAYCALCYAASGDVEFSQKPMSTVGCPENIMNTSTFPYKPAHGDAKLHLLHEDSEGVLTSPHVPKLYQWSFYHYSTVGVVITLIVSLVWGDLVYGINQGQQMGGNIINIVLPVSEVKRKRREQAEAEAQTVAKGIATQTMNNFTSGKGLEMTTVREEREVPKVHEPVKALDNASKTK